MLVHFYERESMYDFNPGLTVAMSVKPTFDKIHLTPHYSLKVVGVVGLRFCATRLNNYMEHNCPKCQKAFARKQGLSMHIKTCGDIKPTFTCNNCGKVKEKSYRTANKFCSHRCAQIGSRVEKDDAWYKRKRALSNEAWQRYHARLKAQTPPDADLKLIQEIYINCPEGYEVDHVIPISKGGLHHQSNLQYLTQLDNRRKGNQLDWSEM